MATDAIAQKCYRCSETRSAESFIRKANGRLYGMCNICLSAVLRKRGPKRRLRHTTTQRTCYLCDRFLPNAAFTRRATGSFFSACKDCNKNVFAHKRRALLLKASGSFTTAEWQAVLARHPTCPSCGRRWEDIPLPPRWTSAATRDHIVALARGGDNSIRNIQPLCYSCNSKKGPRPSPSRGDP